MKPWCDRPYCVRQTQHEHAREPDKNLDGSQSAPGASESAADAQDAPQEPTNGTAAQERSHDEALAVGREVLQRADEKRRKPSKRSKEMCGQLREATAANTPPGPSAPPESEDKGGASPEVEAGDGPDGSRWAEKWEAAGLVLAELDADLERARAQRVELLREMTDAGLSYGDVAAVTGISRQRVGQLLKGS